MCVLANTRQWHSQVTDDAQALHVFVFVVVFFFWLGGGGACILGVATQIVLETIFEMPLVLNRE